MKKLVSLLLALVMVLSVAAVASAEKTLVWAEVNPLDTVVGKTAVAFKDKIEEISGGQIKIDLQAGGVLGTEAQILDGLNMGDDSVDIMRISAFALSGYNCPKATLLSLPYTFVSGEHFWKFATSELAQEFLLEPVTSESCTVPVRGLFYFHEGFRHFFLKKEVATVADLSGLKIRVSNDPVMTGMVKGLGAIPAVVAFGELYSALQTGVVDAAEQPTTNYMANAFQEVAPYLWQDGHTLGAVQVIIREEVYEDMTDEEKAWLTEACNYAADYARNLVDGAEAETVEALQAQGCTVIPVSAETKAELAALCADVVAENSKGYEDLYAQIVAMQ